MKKLLLALMLANLANATIADNPEELTPEEREIVQDCFDFQNCIQYRLRTAIEPSGKQMEKFTEYCAHQLTLPKCNVMENVHITLFYLNGKISGYTADKVDPQHPWLVQNQKCEAIHKAKESAFAAFKSSEQQRNIAELEASGVDVEQLKAELLEDTLHDGRTANQEATVSAPEATEAK